MEIRLYDRSDAPEILRLWNGAGVSAGYAPFDAAALDELLLAHAAFCPESAFVLAESGAVCGFAAGCTGENLAQGAVRGYVSCVLLDRAHDTAGNTAALLGAVERSFLAKGKRVAAVTFFNPLRLPWIIPGTPGFQHNNMPGIPKDLPLYERMLALGYREAATEMAMVLDLAGFTYPAALGEREAAMAAQGYTVDWYREGVHRGVDEMVASLGNSMWDAEIPAAAHGGMRLLVALSGDTVAGFTGPVYPESTGRGYFAGIAVEEKYRGHGLGKLLFYRLCRAEKECGARYMSLFTGTENPAQNIYKEAGFTPRRYFAVMIKELKP